MTVELTPEQSASIQSFVQTGAYRNEADVIDQALRSLLERDELRRKIQELMTWITADTPSTAKMN